MIIRVFECPSGFEDAGDAKTLSEEGTEATFPGLAQRIPHLPISPEVKVPVPKMGRFRYETGHAEDV